MFGKLLLTVCKETAERLLPKIKVDSDHQNYQLLQQTIKAVVSLVILFA